MATDSWVGVLSRQAAGPGGVASGSGGEAPDPGSPRGQGGKRARTSTSTSTSPGDTRCPPRPLITARHASRTAVVSSPELLEHVLTFLGGRRWAVKDLGRAALVCRLWREVAEGGEVWGPVASELMPEMGRRMSEVGARRCMLERGLCHRDQKAFVWSRWRSDLRLQVEVWDNLGHTFLLSAEGKMGLSVHPHVLALTGADRVEVVGPSFSAASKDPVRRRFASIDDCFRRGPDTVEKGVFVRVYVRDERRGRQALMWEHCYRQELQCVDVPLDNPMRPHLPEGSRWVRQAQYFPIHSAALPGQALNAALGFYVRPEAGQEGVAEADKMWRMAGGDQDNYGHHKSFFHLRFHEDVTNAQLASFMRGLLDP
jgi:hypothetical protein